MRRSQYFLPLLKENPADAQVPSHRLMLRSGMIRQVSAGTYNWLPLGWKILRKVEDIVREEMDKAGACEIHMPMFQPAELWQETGRWDKYDAELLRLKDRHDHDGCLGPTHEEVVTDIYRKNIKSYRDLPMALYQVQWKFRDETRPRFGVMRGREFYMKDCYSFDVDADSLQVSYDKMKEAYHAIFKRLGVDYRVVVADSGTIGGDVSEEFQVLADTGEDELLFDPDGDYAVNVEKHDSENSPVPEDKLERKRGIEVGNIFQLGQVYSKPMKAMARLADGSDVPVFMGCYGIGIDRTVAAAIEQNHDENGILWPDALAPFHVGMINLRCNEGTCVKAADELYDTLIQKGFDVLYDDRDEPAGVKFAEMDLIGLPWQCVVGPKGLAEGKMEWKNRRSGERLELPVGQLPAGMVPPVTKAA